MFQRVVSDKINFLVKNAGTDIIDGASSLAVLPGVINRAGYSYSSTDFYGALNGKLEVSQNGSYSYPGTMSMNFFGSDDLSGTQIKGHVRKLKYWSTPLSPEALMQMTE